MKSTKQKQKFLKFLTNFLKREQKKMKQTTKPTKIFLRQQKKLKRSYYSELFTEYENNIKNTWKSINEVLGKTTNGSISKKKDSYK